MNRWVRRGWRPQEQSFLYLPGLCGFLSFAPFCMNDDASFMDYSFSGINTVKTLKS